MQWRELLDRCREGGRLSPEEALLLLEEADFLELGRVAARLAWRRYGRRVTFIIDRNINYTNICTSRCRFCAFYRGETDPDAYLLSRDEILARIEEAQAMGATQIMLQGGLHPRLRIEYFESLLSAIKERFEITIHSFSPPEISHLAAVSGITLAETLERLRQAGLDSLPGGGAEILVNEVRQRISPGKISADRWLEVMRTAHAVGLKSTATMMMGCGETLADRVRHFAVLRDLQDQTGGFRAFIAWTFQPGNTQLGGEKISSLDYLKTLAVSRLFLDNFAHIQGSWLTQGKRIGQLSLLFGADDLGSIMLEENVVRAAGVTNAMTREEMIRLIRAAGREPALRDTTYRVREIY
jgi:cyclic dehypoxanthinyl futalosine synthase